MKRTSSDRELRRGIIRLGTLRALVRGRARHWNLVAARIVQGMACVWSGQAPAWPLVSGRRGCRGSAAQGWVLTIISVQRLEMIFGCP